MDKLEEIFKLQDQLNKRIGVNTDDLTEEEQAKWVLNYTRAMQQEMAELIDSVPWKWWAKYQDFDPGLLPEYYLPPRGSLRHYF